MKGRINKVVGLFVLGMIGVLGYVDYGMLVESITMNRLDTIIVFGVAVVLAVCIFVYTFYYTFIYKPNNKERKLE